MWLKTAFIVGLLNSYFQVIESQNDQLVTTANEFSFKIYKQLLEDKNRQDFICSPYSISVALSMLLMGANGQTSDEIISSLGFKEAGLDKNQIKEQFKALLQQQNKENSLFDLKVSNSMWTHKGYTILEQYKTTLQNEFFSDAQTVDFGNSDAAVKVINEWVNKKTKGKIPQIMQDVASDTKLVLINAIYFNGTWERTFKKKRTNPLTFHNVYSKSTKKVQMMNMISNFQYKDLPEIQSELLEIPYKGDYSMVIVLPKKKDGLKDVEKKLSVQILSEALKTATKQLVSLNLPKFKVNSFLQLNDILKPMGIKSAFGGAADFSGITGGKELSVSKVYQKGICEVDEEGTVAAAVTAIEAGSRSIDVPLSFISFFVDHPFLYLILNKKNNLIIFMGRGYKL